MARGPARGSVAHLNEEITITGGGLAGLSLAIGLRRRGVAVTVNEAGHYPRHRVCGEFISGVKPTTLETLGIADLFDGALRHRSFEWRDESGLLATGELPDAAWGISRHRLDALLSERLQQLGGRLFTGQRLRPAPAEGAVWTAGRRPSHGPWIGLKGHFRIAGNTDLEMHCGPQGYAGVAGIEDGWANVCGLFRADHSIGGKGAPLLVAYLRACGLHHLADRLHSAEHREGSFCAIAGFSLGYQPPMPGITTIGDAATMIPPFTGNGMSMAFQSAECALEPLRLWSLGRMTWEQSANAIRRTCRARFRRRMAASRLLHPWLFSSSARAALRSLSQLGLLPTRLLIPLIR
jgi:menaquinone-9 beta-reductase